MKHRRLIAPFFSALLAATPLAGGSQTIYGGAQTLNGLQDQANTRSNFQLQERQNAELRRSFRAQDMIEQEKQDMKNHPLKAPVLYVTDDASVTTIDKMAKALQPMFKGESESQIRTYLGQRYADYKSSVTASGMKPASLASACDYVAENTYAAGAHIDATADRETIRGTCIMYVQKAQAYGKLTTNTDRLELLELYAVAGSLFHDLSTRAVPGATISQSGVQDQAREFFKRQFAKPMEALPPSKFECIFATAAASCDTIARIYPKYVKAEAAAYP